MIKKLISNVYMIFSLLAIIALAIVLYYFRYQLPVISPVLIKKYYDSGAYEKKVKNISEEAIQHFSNISIRENSLIIFDVDDTAVYNLRFRSTLDLTAPKTTAILPVLDLYKYLVKRGLKIIFLTSRNCSMYEFTKNELIHAGYTKFEDLICMPNEFNDDYTAVWKAEQRKKLAQKYTIIGSIADRKRDFFDNNNGYIVKLPNYLY